MSSQHYTNTHREYELRGESLLLRVLNYFPMQKVRLRRDSVFSWISTRASASQSSCMVVSVDASLPNLLGDDIHGSRSAVDKGCPENEFKVFPLQGISRDAREFP